MGTDGLNASQTNQIIRVIRFLSVFIIFKPYILDHELRWWSHPRINRKPPGKSGYFATNPLGHLSAVIARSGEAIDHRKNPAADLPEFRSTKPTRRARIG